MLSYTLVALCGELFNVDLIKIVEVPLGMIGEQFHINDSNPSGTAQAVHSDSSHSSKASLLHRGW